MNWAAGIDVGGTNLKAVAVATDGTVLERATRATADGTASAADWVAHARALLADFTTRRGCAPVALGVCAPGLAAADGRSIAHLPGKLAGLAGLDWTTALASAASAQPPGVAGVVDPGFTAAPGSLADLHPASSRPATSRPPETGSAPASVPFVPVLNDAHAALLGEVWVGAARGRRHVVMLTLGTGVGGAVLSDGRLLRGAIGRAGHIGHMSLDPDGPVSIVGMPGAIEVMIGDCTVAQRSGGRFPDTAALVAAHRAGDVEAGMIWLRSVRALAFALAGCVNLFDPEVIVLGGGIARAGDALFAPLTREIDRIEWQPGGHRVSIAPAALGEWAGAIGAAWQALAPPPLPDR